MATEQLLEDGTTGNANIRVNECIDVGGSSGDDSYQEPEVEYHNFDEETLHHMELNDRHIEGLNVDFNNNYANQRQRRLGVALAKHTHLKALVIDDGSSTSNGNGFQEFCQGLARNRSIEHLRIYSCDLTNVDIFQILTPFFEHNSNLRSIDVTVCYGVGRSIRSFSSALSKCSGNSLKRIKLGDIAMGDDAAADVIEALNRQGNLEHLSLVESKIGRKSCVALAKLLKESTLKLQELDVGGNPDIDDECITMLANSLANKSTTKALSLGGLCIRPGEGRSAITSTGWSSFSTILYHPMCSLQKLHLKNMIDDEGAIALGNALSVNKTLKFLNLGHNRSITVKGWRAFSLCLGGPSSSLDELHIGNCNIDDEAAAAIANALAGNTTLKSLDMSSSSSITPRGWRTFFSLLLNSELSLDELNIPYNNIDDEGAAILVEVLANYATLKILCIDGNRSITAAGLQMFPNLLRRPDCALKDLYLGNINDEVFIDFANSLANNKSLEELYFIWGRFQVTSRGWGALSTVLCDKSSIANTYSSNHTLKYMKTGALFHSSLFPSPVRIYLEMNENDNKAEVARQKIIKHHFSDVDANIHVFTGMETKTMPSAISWIGRDHIGYSLLYHLVLSMPALVES